MRLQPKENASQPGKLVLFTSTCDKACKQALLAARGKYFKLKKNKNKKKTKQTNKQTNKTIGLQFELVWDLSQIEVDVLWINQKLGSFKVNVYTFCQVVVMNVE